MAFAVRPDGLIDVDTPMGPLPMAPEVATQLGYVPQDIAPPPVPTLGQAGAVAGLPPGDLEVLGLSPPSAAPVDMRGPVAPAGATLMTPEQERAHLATKMASVDPSTLPQGQAQQPMAQQSQGQSPQMSAYDRVMAAGPMSSSASTSSTSGPAPITGPARERIDKAQNAALEAARKRTEQEGAEADLLTQQTQLEANQARDQVEADAIRRVEMDRRLAAYKSKRDELRRAVPDTIDPNAWDRTGGPASIMAAVSVMLGSIAEGLGADSNPGKAIVDDLINRSIESQREEIRQAENAAERADNDYQRFLDLYGDDILAEKQLQLNGYEAAKKEIQARIQGTQAEQVRAVGEQGIAELDAAQAVIQNEMDGRAGQIVRQTTTQQESPEQLHQRALEAENQASDPYAGMNDASRRDAIGRIVRMPDGRQAYATTVQDAQATNKLIGARSRYVSNLDEMRKIIRENIGRTLSPELRGRLKAMIQENKIALKDTNELGAITASDAELVTPLSGENILGLTSFDSNTLGSIDEAQKYVDAQLTHRMGNLYEDPMAQRAIRSATTNRLGARDAGID